ncbi:ATP-binding protein [Hymenobacter sp. 5414T-23]|uniref:sensor histidine kinase n=1 Tax=Hymenobacter sp. 5414T-23 TaxID=2932252 RepID=UPI001FD5F47E|nr:ATP-binding protein [Hymenobacter sp. 5414T-23]UOQ79347.1 ATP-binding protein [Hymenobacter sp. 5414T-23]
MFRPPALQYCLESSVHPGSGAGVAALWAGGRFQPVGRRVFQAGFTQDRLWLRAVVVNSLSRRARFVWSLYSFVDSATLFVQPGGRGIPRYAAGTNCRLVAARRPFAARPHCLPFWLEPHERAVLYLAVDNHTGAYYLPTRFASAEGFMVHEYNLLFTSNWSWLLGLFLSSVLLNLLLYFLLHDPIHLWYAAYVLFGTWFLIMEDGLDGGLLSQRAYALGWQLGQYGVMLLAMACGLRIMALFLRLRQGWPRLWWLSIGLSVGAATYVLAYALFYQEALQAGPQVLAMLNGGREAMLWLLLLGGCFIVFTVWAKGRKPQRQLARLYGLTYFFFFAGASNFLLNHTGWFNIHLVEPNALAWGLTLELLTLSGLLTVRFRNSQRQNAELRLRQAHERAAASHRLIAAQEHEKQALLAQKNETLEHEVNQRTQELQHSLTDLRATQAQLIQKEKMASLGELTAGIAHEMQNPLNFVNNFAEVSTELLADLKEAQAAGDAAEVTALADDIHQNLAKIHQHGQRAAGIVRGMLEHSQTRAGERRSTDLNRLCDEYLHLAYQGLRAKDESFTAELSTDYLADLPEVLVVSTDVGRVLLNLFANAFYAVRQRQQAGNEGYQAQVRVRTLVLHQQVQIQVTDNGMGMTPEVQAKIFQPFFTTKPPGEGTGLGLSLSHDIIAQGHGGTLTVESRPGAGATFTVSLPLNGLA